MRRAAVAASALAVVLSFTVFALGLLGANPGRLGSAGVPETQAANLPLYFVENAGQIEGPADYYADAGSFEVFLNALGISYVQSMERDGKSGEWLTSVSFVGANEGVVPLSTGDKPATVSYFKGSPEEWKTGLSASPAVTYPGLWDGIDLVVRGDGGVLKYEFTVAPGAKPDDIQLRIDGAEASLSNGELYLKTPAGTLVDRAPFAGQPGADGANVEVGYRLQQLEGGALVTFDLGTYDSATALTIDPAVVRYASYVGGSDYDDAQSVVLDEDENIYWQGRGFSTGVFTGVSGYDDTYDANFDAYVAKFTPDGMTMLWGTYIGGAADDSAFGVAVDAAHDVYITGTTQSNSPYQVPAGAFPATVGAYDIARAGDADGYICKIDATGTTLDYCTYFGGLNSEYGFAIAVDDQGRAYSAGTTHSSDGEGFPVTPGSFDTTFNDGGTITEHDAFLLRLNADGTDLEYSGFIGGDSGSAFRSEEAFWITLDDSYNAYVSGNTDATQTTFPDGDLDLNDTMPASGADTTQNGGIDGFLIRINPTGTSFLNITFAGTALEDELGPTFIEDDGDIIVDGWTNSAAFPVTGDFFESTHGGDYDAIVQRYNSTLTSVLNSGYLGGSGSDFANNVDNSISEDADGNIFMTGYSSSTEATFPVKDGPDVTYNGGPYDGFVGKFTPDGEVIYLGYVGGSGDDGFDGSALTADGSIWLVGTVEDSTNYPNGYGFYSIPGWDQTHGGGTWDGQLVKVSVVPAGIPVTESGGSTNVSEAGSTSDDYTVVLLSQPQFDVTVSITPNTQQTTDKSSLTFTPLNWDVPQQVIVTAVDDSVVECPHDGLITHAATSQDLNYDGIAVASVVPHITDNEVCDPTTRVSGGSPRELSIAVSQARFGDDEANVVLIAREDIWIDAFVGTPLSTITEGPLLLNPSDSLSSDVLMEIDRVLSGRNQRVYVLGREDAISEGVVNELAAAGFTDVVRLGGVNRDETASIIAEELQLLNPRDVDQVFIAENVRLVDAMTVSAAAADDADGTVNAILLGDRGSATVDEFTAAFLRSTPSVTKAVLVGGQEALPSALEDDLYVVRPGMALSRVSGADRYGTARAVADLYFNSPAGAVVAGGEQQSIAGALSVSAQSLQGIVGALLAGGLAADHGYPLLITRPTELPATISSYLTLHSATIEEAIIVGNESDVSATVAATIQRLIQ